MPTIGGTTPVLLARRPVDLPDSFDRHCGLVSTGLGLDPKSAHSFVFTDRRRTLNKILAFDGSRLGIPNRRLVAGRFTWPHAEGTSLRLRNEKSPALVNHLEWTG